MTLIRYMMVLICASAILSAAEVVSFPSGNLTLHGEIYKPKGDGPFPAVVFNHGSAKDIGTASVEAGPLFASHGWVFFMPHRRGQGLSASAGPYIRDEISTAFNAGGQSVAVSAMIRLLETDHLNDQLAALAWLRKQPYVQSAHVAVVGSSFGGIETVLGAERGSYCAAVDLAGGAESWAEAPALRAMMTRAVGNSRVPVFFIQAENDYDLSPTRTLSKAMQDAGKVSRVKIYPPFGNSQQDGHTFAYFGSSVWASDVLQFLGEYCGARAHASR